MCGIVGYIGEKQAQPVIFNLLKNLEYRGYDSCGIAVLGSHLKLYKDAIRIEALEKDSPWLEGTIGIGHTRWATHGGPSVINAHPHLDCSSKIAIVHNGIINNYQQLKDQLIKEGHRFVSETDTEVVAHLLEKHYQGDMIKALEAASYDIEGSYALIVCVEDEPRLFVAKKDSPLVIALGDKDYYIASDVPATLDYAKRVVYLEDGDIAAIEKNNLQIINNGITVEREEHLISWSREDVKKTGYEHFMLKEIHEQPKVIRDTLMEYLVSEHDISSGITYNLDRDTLAIIACGTSYHAGLIGKYIIEELVGIPVRVDLASEFNHGGRALGTTEAIVISQSGETADTLMAMKRLRQGGIRTLAITNVPGSSASRFADYTVYTKAGPELGVAATKTFISQLVALYAFALSYPGINSSFSKGLISEFRQLSNKVQQVLDNTDQIINCADYLSKYSAAFILGRGINFPIALEGALKLKEIAYIRAEGYAAGELKHGPFALLDQDTPVIVIAARDNTYMPMLGNIKEVKARKSPVIVIADEHNEAIEELGDFTLKVPYVSKLFSPFVNTVALQLLAYYAARKRGCAIDFPRNLAKSVTVE